MSGLFDIMNNQNAGEDDPQVAPSYWCGLFLMKIAGIRTNAELRTELETLIGQSIDAETVTDLLAVIAYIDAGVGEAGKMARLQRFCSVAGIWETGQGSLTEAEARTMTGAF